MFISFIFPHALRELEIIRKHGFNDVTSQCCFIVDLRLRRWPNHLPFKPSRCINASFFIPENRLNFPTTKGFNTRISIKLVYQYMTIFLTFPPTSSHLHPLQVKNCDSNSRLVVDEDDNGKFGL